MIKQNIELTDFNYEWLHSMVSSGKYRTINEALNEILNCVRQAENNDLKSK